VDVSPFGSFKTKVDDEAIAIYLDDFHTKIIQIIAGDENGDEYFLF